LPNCSEPVRFETTYEHLFIHEFMRDTHADSSIAELAELFKLLGEHTRLRIVLACADEPIAVNDIAHGSNSAARW